MGSLRRELALVLLAAFGAHALTYFLLRVLPDAAVVSLGIESAREDVLAAFHAAHQERSYVRVLADLARLDLGRTLDGIPVAREMADALAASASRVGAAFILVLAACVTAGLIPPRDKGGVSEAVASFLAFLPPYVHPFLGLVFVLTTTLWFGLGVGQTLVHVVSVVALSMAPAAMVFTQALGISRRNLQSDFARTLLAVGATPLYQRSRLLHNLAAEIVPSLEKVLTNLVAVLLFVEPILGLGGFGTMAVRAVKRSDADLLLAVTLTLAIAVGVSRLVSLLVRRHYGLSA
jgi:ABC-type dipeptide/oligopeptide/nickel transport system permease component